MNKFQAKQAGLERRKRRVRAKVSGTAERPRLAVHRTNAHIYAQVIDDQDGKTICSASTLSPEFKETGCFLKFCDEVRRYTSVPLCGVGGLNDPDFVEQQLASGRIQCAAMCRQLLADPNWVNKLQSGNGAKIHRCVRCNKKCLGGLIAHQGTRCIYDALNAKEQGSI